MDVVGKSGPGGPQATRHLTADEQKKVILLREKQQGTRADWRAIAKVMNAPQSLHAPRSPDAFRSFYLRYKEGQKRNKAGMAVKNCSRCGQKKAGHQCTFSSFKPIAPSRSLDDKFNLNATISDGPALVLTRQDEANVLIYDRVSQKKNPSFYIYVKACSDLPQSTELTATLLYESSKQPVPNMQLELQHRFVIESGAREASCQMRLPCNDAMPEMKDVKSNELFCICVAAALTIESYEVRSVQTVPFQLRSMAWLRNRTNQEKKNTQAEAANAMVTLAGL